METRHYQRTWTSDETRASEEELASRIVSHVAQVVTTTGGKVEVRVVASASFLNTLKGLVPYGADVRADLAAPLSAGFDVRVIVVEPAGTASFELKRVGKVTSTVLTGGPRRRDGDRHT